jgi:hypothetical protein
MVICETQSNLPQKPDCPHRHTRSSPRKRAFPNSRMVLASVLLLLVLFLQMVVLLPIHVASCLAFLPIPQQQRTTTLKSSVSKSTMIVPTEKYRHHPGSRTITIMNPPNMRPSTKNCISLSLSSSDDFVFERGMSSRQLEQRDDRTISSFYDSTDDRNRKESSSQQQQQQQQPTTGDNHTPVWNPEDDDHQDTRIHQKVQQLWNTTTNRLQLPSSYRLPPFFIEDWNVLLYDILLIVNLSVSISFWVIHRFDVSYIGIAFNEGCLLSLLWICAGLWNGSFLYSAIDGHYPPRPPPMKNRTAATATNSDPTDPYSGGPLAAGVLAFHTYINTINLRLLWALGMAMIEHRPALSTASELLLPLEFGYGVMLMMLWRTLHSSFVLR